MTQNTTDDPYAAWAAERAAMTPEELAEEQADLEAAVAADAAEMERLEFQALQMIANGHDLLAHVYSGLDMHPGEQAYRAAYERHMKGLLSHKPGPKPKGRPPRKDVYVDIAAIYAATEKGKLVAAVARARELGIDAEPASVWRQIHRVKKRRTDPWS